jgi:hypothetical protein
MGPCGGRLRLVRAERDLLALQTDRPHATLRAVNTYLPIKTNLGLWTVEWSVSGVPLGHVHGIYATEMEAILAAFIMAERDRRGLLSPGRSGAGAAASRARRRPSG